MLENPNISLYTNSTAVLVLHQCREDSALKYTVSSLFDPINKVESALSVVVCYTYHMPTTDSDGKDMMWCDKKTLIFKNTTPLIDSLKWNDLWVMKVKSYNFSCSEKKSDVFGLMAPKQSVFPCYKLRNKHGQCFLATSCKISTNSGQSPGLIKAPD